MDHHFKPGESGNPHGRPKGAVNKLTKSVREAVLQAFNDLQEDDEANLLTWAKKHPRDFYQIAAKLIPQEVVGKDGDDLLKKILVEIVTTDGAKS